MPLYEAKQQRAENLKDNKCWHHLHLTEFSWVQLTLIDTIHGHYVDIVSVFKNWAAMNGSPQSLDY